VIVKVPEKRKDGGSSFADLINYLIERKGDSYALDNSRNRRRVDGILREAIENIRNAEKHLRSFRRTDTLNASAIRASFENFRKIADSFEWSGQYHTFGVNDLFNEQGVDVDEYKTIITNIQRNLRSAETNLRQTGRIDAALQDRINAHRANLAGDVESVRRKSYRDKSFIEFGLDEEQHVVTSSGVSCLHNCLSLNTAFAEMNAVAAENTRAKNAVYHFLISWPSEEKPEDSTIFDCAKYAQDSIGMNGHQFVYVIHRDTENVHVHIAVNRIHPETYKAVFPKQDYFKLHKAMRELELKYGFTRDNGLYKIEKEKIETNFSKKERKIPQKAADMERFSGLESFYSYVRGAPRKEIVSALKDTKLTWEILHHALAKYDLEIKEKGRGFAIYSISSPEITPVKASDMHEMLSKGRLIKRLGNFSKISSTNSVDQVDRYHPYREIKRDPAAREARRLERAERRKQLKQDYKDYKREFVIKKISSDEVSARYAVIRQNANLWRQQTRENEPNRLVRKAMYSIIAFEKLRQKERLKIELAKERLELKQAPDNKPLTYKEWTAIQAESGNFAAISQMRGFAYYERRKQHQDELIKHNGLKINGSDVIDPVIPLGATNYKILSNGSVQCSDLDGITLTDAGEFIYCNNSQKAMSLMDALKLAEIKMQETPGCIQITGSNLFKFQAYELISLHEMKIVLIEEQQKELEKVKVTMQNRTSFNSKTTFRGQPGAFRQ